MSFAKITWTKIDEAPALATHALLPIVLNTYTGLRGVPDQVVEAADGVGMSNAQRLRRHLRRDGESSLPDLLPAHVDVDGRILVEAHNGRTAGIGRHGGGFPGQGNAFAASFVGS